MYVWLGINVEEQMLECKEKAKKIDECLQFGKSCFTLPQHITLKNAFFIEPEKLAELVQFIEEEYAQICPFEIKVRGLEKYSNIIWIRMKRNYILDKIHDYFNDALLEKFQIGMQEYDLDYKYHTTLFMDPDSKKIEDAYQKIKDVNLPSKIEATNFVIGTSESGDLGTYSIYREQKRIRTKK